MIEWKTRPDVKEVDELSFSILIIHSTKLTFISHNTTDQSGPSQLPKFKATINQMSQISRKMKNAIIISFCFCLFTLRLIANKPAR